MPVPISATTFVALAAVLGGPPADGVAEQQASWRIIDRASHENTVQVNCVRSIVSAQACRVFVAKEADRLGLGTPIEAAGGPITQFSFGAGKLSYSCAQIDPDITAVVAVTGSENQLKEAGYTIGHE